MKTIQFDDGKIGIVKEAMMTREDAIYEIRQLAVLSTNKNIERITEALNMAIEALKQTEPQTCRNCKWSQTVCRLGDNPPCHSYEPKTEPQNIRRGEIQ